MWAVSFGSVVRVEYRAGQNPTVRRKPPFVSSAAMVPERALSRRRLSFCPLHLRHVTNRANRTFATRRRGSDIVTAPTLSKVATEVETTSRNLSFAEVAAAVAGFSPAHVRQILPAKDRRFYFTLYFTCYSATKNSGNKRWQAGATTPSSGKFLHVYT